MVLLSFVIILPEHNLSKLLLIITQFPNDLRFNFILRRVLTARELLQTLLLELLGGWLRLSLRGVLRGEGMGGFFC